jgi:hypothetical protein
VQPGKASAPLQSGAEGPGPGQAREALGGLHLTHESNAGRGGGVPATRGRSPCNAYLRSPAPHSWRAAGRRPVTCRPRSRRPSRPWRGLRYLRARRRLFSSPATANGRRWLRDRSRSRLNKARERHMPQSHFSHAQETIRAAAESRQECADFIRRARAARKAERQR